jgi:hypothetical protein
MEWAVTKASHVLADYFSAMLGPGTGTSQLFIQARSALTLWTPTSDELDSLIRTDWRAMRTAVKRMQQLSSGPRDDIGRSDSA